MRGLIGFIVVTMLSGCVLGPTFHSPKPPRMSYKTPQGTASSAVRQGAAQTFHQSVPIPQQWWTVFHSKPLNQLLIEAFRANPDLKAASAALSIAHENTAIQRAQFFPQVGGVVNPSHQLTAGTFASNLSSNAYLYTLTLASLNISYAPDVLGLNHRRVESLEAVAEVAAFQCEAVHLTLASHLVLAVIQEGLLQTQLQATLRQIAIAQEQLQLVKKQRDLGQVGADLVLSQEALYANIKGLLPPLRQQLAEQSHLIAALSGHFPNEPRPPIFTLKQLTLPQALPIRLPSELVRQRPDIRAAEAAMHAASAAVGVALINRFPSIVLSATGGVAPVSFSPNSVPSYFSLLPTGGAWFWGFGANVVGSIFDGGALWHQQQAAMAAYTLSVAQYRRVVLDAFQQVADTLKAIEADASALKITAEGQRALQKSLAVAKKKWALGLIGYPDVLGAEQAYQQGVMVLAARQAARLNDTVALFQALGGGWIPQQS